MNRSACIAAAACIALFAPTPVAEAARCPSGSIYRQSAGVCQTRASAQRAGVRIYPTRSAKASTRDRYKRSKPAKAVVITYEHHVYNWAYDNREMLERTSPQ
jgi:hypothetical protein